MLSGYGGYNYSFKYRQYSFTDLPNSFLKAVRKYSTLEKPQRKAISFCEKYPVSKRDFA